MEDRSCQVEDTSAQEWWRSPKVWKEKHQLDVLSKIFLVLTIGFLPVYFISLIRANPYWILASLLLCVHFTIMFIIMKVEYKRKPEDPNLEIKYPEEYPRDEEYDEIEERTCRTLKKNEESI